VSPMTELPAAIESVFNAFVPARLSISTKAVSLSTVEETWNSQRESTYRLRPVLAH
jgi:hypothetical protein